ncbi:hypothetical protein GUJ93_ZPchr0006g44146 [Zizania palustris]|uniref:Uncharacterized protein n=1 Tax=Zizania palustris TaxID=103762 RepID=A0A8J5TGJ6_ZIZPA|nr:hypothetical protein GUJ93_ZPchr0006g44146 [Zizania palustris]
MMAASGIHRHTTREGCARIVTEPTATTMATRGIQRRATKEGDARTIAGRVETESKIINILTWFESQQPGGGKPAAPDLSAPASGPRGGRLAALDLAAPASDPGGGVADPAMVVVPSLGKGEEKAAGDEKEKTGLAGGGSPAMEVAAAVPAAREERGSLRL